MSNMMVDPEDVDRPAENWKYPYVAGAVDWGSNFRIVISQSGDRAVGYLINPKLQFSSTGQTELGFLADFCDQHDLHPNLQELKNRYRLEIARRDDLEAFLKLVFPYLIGRYEPTEVLLDHLIPGLNDGKASSKQGFIELMGYVDHIRTETSGRGEPKYDQAYFREEWDV